MLSLLSPIISIEKGVSRENKGKSVSFSFWVLPRGSLKLIFMGLKLAMWNVFVLLVLSSWICNVSASVSYDSRAITINGERRILISGSIHYPRSTPEVHFTKCVFLSITGSVFSTIRYFPSDWRLQIFNFFFSFTSFFQLARQQVFLSKIWVFFWGAADVARSYSEGKRRRFGCDSDLRFLEWP